MSTHMVENLISHNLPAGSLPEPGTSVPGAEGRLALRHDGPTVGVRGRMAVRLPGLTSGARGELVGRSQRGFTLVELLVVVFILLLVSAVSIPIVAPALQGRHVREASRQINSYFAVARDTALRNGRPVGVSIERFVSKDDQGNAVGLISDMSVLLQQVEVPENYSGDMADSEMILECTQFGGTEAGLPPIAIRIVSMGVPPSQDVGWTDLIRIGDQIRLGTQKKVYEITWTSTDLTKTRGSYLLSSDTPSFDGTTPSTQFWAITPVDGNYVMPTGAPARLPLPLPTMPTASKFMCDLPPLRGQIQDLAFDATAFYIKVPYTIIRQPVKTSTPPLQLTGSVVLDLNWSGINDSYFVQRDTTAAPFTKLTAVNAGESVAAEDKSPIVIMFSPSGNVSRLYLSDIVDGQWNWGWVAPTSAIHLLIGQREAVPPENAELVNWLNLDNLWVSIHPQTGLLTTTENAEVDPSLNSPIYAYTGGVRDARAFATRAKSMGGR